MQKKQNHLSPMPRQQKKVVSKPQAGKTCERGKCKIHQRKVVSVFIKNRMYSR